jgi:hypothetical protein
MCKQGNNFRQLKMFTFTEPVSASKVQVGALPTVDLVCAPAEFAASRLPVAHWVALDMYGGDKQHHEHSQLQRYTHIGMRAIVFNGMFHNPSLREGWG